MEIAEASGSKWICVVIRLDKISNDYNEKGVFE